MALGIIFLVVINCLMVQSDPDTNFTIMCRESMFSADFTSFAVKDRDVFITLKDPNCNSSVVHDKMVANITQVWINSNFDECGTVITETNDTILITNTARVKITQKLRAGVTQREYYYDYKIQCELARYKNISTGDSFYNVSEEIIILKRYNKSEEFNLDMSMDFYTADNFMTKADSTLTVNSDEYIHVGINENQNNSNFKFIVNQCFATPSPLFDDVTSDVFFENKCSLDNTFSIVSPDNNYGGIFNFKIQSFLFIQEKGSVYFHCRMFICNSDSNSNECTQSCSGNKRFRRDVAHASRDRRSISKDDVVQEIVITSKKIVFDNTGTCEKLSPTCPPHSTCHPLEPAECVCDDGYVFSMETKTCTSQRRLEIKGIHLNMEWKDIYADTSSLEFRKLAAEKERLLYKLFQATGTEREIEGVKVIGVRKGSVILDVEIIYAKTTTYETAYKSFIKSLTTKPLKATTVHRSLNIIQDTTPSIGITKETNKMEKITLVIVIVVLLVVLFVSGITFYKIKQLRRRTTKENISGFDNSGIDMNNLS